MAGDSKILTVSYGTFSCTLEGFDDPFAAMREIAEYFRDLAADDRYFGAEPPTPDPERLEMIAQRSARSTVSARVDSDGALSLHQAEEADLAVDDGSESELEEVEEVASEPETTLDAAAEETTDEDSGAAQDMGDFEDAGDEVTVEPIAEVVEAEPEAAEEAPEPVAAKDEAPGEPATSIVDRLARIRAAVAASAVDSEEFAEEPDSVSVPEGETVVTSLRDAFREEGDAPGGPSPRGAPQAASADDVAEPKEPTQADASAQTEKPDTNEVEGATLLIETPIETDTGDGEADRIFREADSQLEGSETRRRHATIKHLKAAVSATVADRNILGWRDRQNEEEKDAYREDLAAAVRPKEADSPAEPVAEAPRAERTKIRIDDEVPDELVAEEKAPERPSDIPLVLGQEERIVSTATNEASPKEAIPRPRAVLDETFEDYAHRVGAEGLGELLEAAAAYCSQILGHSQFSRPQIMKQVAEASEEDFTREDGLRSFGILLREGKIVKLKRGLFALSDESRFVTRNRLAGE